MFAFPRTGAASKRPGTARVPGPRAEVADLPSAAEVSDGGADVLVLDLCPPRGAVMNAIGALREQAPETRIVVVSMEQGAGLVRSALAHGASGYVLKEHADTELADAVRAAAGDQRYIGRSASAQSGTL